MLTFIQTPASLGHVFMSGIILMLDLIGFPIVVQNPTKKCCVFLITDTKIQQKNVADWNIISKQNIFISNKNNIWSRRVRSLAGRKSERNENEKYGQ